MIGVPKRKEEERLRRGLLISRLATLGNLGKSSSLELQANGLKFERLSMTCTGFGKPGTLWLSKTEKDAAPFH